MSREKALRASLRLARIPGREVECPRCRAGVGRACTGAKGQQLHNLHGSRYDLAGLPTALTRREPE